MVRPILAAAAVTAAVTALFACGSPPANGSEAKALAVVAALEKMVPLPDATRPLAGYERFYSVSKDRIAAVYLPAPRGSGRVHLVEGSGLPQGKSEGCSVVNLIFDRASNQFARILCNQVALSRVELAPRIAAKAPLRGERG